MIPTCQEYGDNDDNDDDEGDDDDDGKHKDKDDLPHPGHRDDDDTNYDAKTTTAMNVRKMLMKSTCQTMVREEAATAYTKYLHRKIKSDDNVMAGNFKHKVPAHQKNYHHSSLVTSHGRVDHDKNYHHASLMTCHGIAQVDSDVGTLQGHRGGRGGA